MKGILADYNLEGHVRSMVTRMRQQPWQEFWDSLMIGAFTLDDLGLDPATSEQVIERLLDYLLGIDRVRGTGRLYLP